MVKIWTGNGDFLDGTTENDREAAVEAIRQYYGWAEAHLCECDDASVAVYETAAEADADAHGAFAVTVFDVFLDEDIN